MPVWKLIPIDLNHRYWKASLYQKEVVVRARSVKKAREIASLRFLTAKKKTILGEETPGDPWAEPTLVSAVEIKGENYPDTGEEEIVGPAEALEYR
jgi:hypothetical protein